MTSYLSISSTRGMKDAEDACLLEWRGAQWYAPLGAVMSTAEDLFTCAAYAELIGELLRVDLEPDLVSQLTTHMIRNRRPAYFGSPKTVFLLPGGSSQRGQGYVLVARKNRFGTGAADDAIEPEAARKMGWQFLQAAEATVQDTLFDGVLRRAGWLKEAELEALFGLLKDLRAGEDLNASNRDRHSGAGELPG